MSPEALNKFQEAVTSFKKQEQNKILEKYEEDKEKLILSLEMFLETKLDGSIKDFQTSLKEAEELKHKYSVAIAETEERLLKENEIRLNAIEDVVKYVLDNTISELHESEKDNRRVYIDRITEMQAKAQQDKDIFIQKGSAVLESIINKEIGKLFETCENDIKKSAQNQMGMEIFEAFYATMSTHFFDSNKEYMKLKEQKDKVEKNNIEIKEKARRNTKI